MGRKELLPIFFIGVAGCGEAKFAGQLNIDNSSLKTPPPQLTIVPNPIEQPVGQQEVIEPLEGSVSLEVTGSTYCQENPEDISCKIIATSPDSPAPTGGSGNGGSGGGGVITTEPQPTKTCPEDPTKCSVPPPPLPPVVKTQEEFYRPGSLLPGQLDLIWVVDDSLSMADKRTIVKDNLKAFSEKIQSFSNLKLGLVSYYDLLPSIPGVKLFHNRVLVGSNNPIALATANSCTATQSSPAGTSSGVRICGQLISDNTGLWRGDIKSGFYNTLADSAGCLFEGGNSRTLNRSVMGMPSCTISPGTRFFTPNNRTAVAFVTDDDEMNVPPSHFIDTMKKALNGDIAACTAQKNCNFPIVFAFGANKNSLRSFTNGGCNATRESRQYGELVTWTGGKYEKATEPEFPFYDICRKDWSPFFDHMLGKIKTATTVIFTTSRTPVIYSVSIKVLKTQYYLNSSGQVVEDTTKRQSPSDPTVRTLKEGVEYTRNGTQVTLQKGAITLPTRTGAVGQRIDGELVRIFYRY